MGKFNYDLKVEVIGGKSGKKKANPEDNKPKKPLISINLKNKTVVSTYSDEQYKTYKFFKSIIDSNIPNEDKVKNISLEIKKEYISCIGSDEHFDFEAISYLDENLFSSIEQLISTMVESNNTISIESIGEVIKRSIHNSVKLFDYEDVFDFNKMNDTITYLIEGFK